jgi:hypothetical protein
VKKPKTPEPDLKSGNQQLMWKVKKPKTPLPPGEYLCKVVDITPKPCLKSGDQQMILILSAPVLGSRENIERLAQVAWENTGSGDFPILPPGHDWVDQETGKVVPLEDLMMTWDKVTTKDIFRRQAAAVALALGFRLGDDVTIKPRNPMKGAPDA